MTFNILKFLRDYRIDHATEGNKHCRPGWVQIHCPFCRKQNFHLGFEIGGQQRIACWYCRGKGLSKTIQALLKCSRPEAWKIVQEYSDRQTRPIPKKRQETNPVKVDVRKECILPSPPECGPMGERHKTYLAERGFDPDLLERVYDLRGTSHLGSYNFRIIAPIYYQGRIVSFQGRDITGKSDLRYKACPMNQEAIHHKHIFYAMDLVKNRTAIMVEGFTDAWRLGPGAIASFGTGFTEEQSALTRKEYKRLFLAFDPEKTAQAVMRDFYLQNSGWWDLEIILVDLKEFGTDPGGMSQEDANHLMKELGLSGWNQ